MNEADVDGVFANSVDAYSRVYLRTALRNLPQVATHPTVGPLTGLFEGVPAVLVAAGPSLDKNIAQVAALKGRAVIIGINQSLKALRAAGVEPDICLAVDPLNMLYHFEGRKVPVLGLVPSVHAGLFEMGESVFTFPASRDTEEWLYAAMGVPQYWHVGNSVAHHMFHLAMHMRCSPIVVIGQDFALDGQRYYASNAGDGGKQLVPEGETLSTKAMYDREAFAKDDPEHFKAVMVPDTLTLMQVPGWGGGEVTTTTDLFPMLTLYKRMAHAAKGQAALFNCTEGGARIDGMQEATLATVAAELVRRPDVQPLNRLRTALAPVDRRAALLDDVRKKRKNLERLGKATAALLAKLDRGPSQAREEFCRAAAECHFFQLWCVRELKAIRDMPAKAHPLHLALLERNLYLAAKGLAQEVGERLRQAATGLAKTSKPLGPSAQVSTKQRFRSA